MVVVNWCVKGCFWMFAIGIAIFFFVNFLYLFKSKSITYFVLYSHASLLVGMFLSTAIYVAEIHWLWKIVLMILSIDIVWFLLSASRYIAFAYYYDELVIKENVLVQIFADKTVKKIKIPNKCQKIATGAICNYSELETIVIPKCVKTFSTESIVNCPRLKTIRFLNKNIEFIESSEIKYKVIKG